MLLAAVSFIPHMDHEEGELVLVAEDYLTALVKNGQIHENFVSGWVDGVYTAYVHVSHRDAHKRDAASQWVRQTEKLVQLQYGVAPEWEIVDDETSLPVPQLSSAGFVYLLSHAMHDGSPVWHGQRGTSLPMPLLPITDRLKEELYHWSLLCRSYDQIWMMEGPLAEAAWNQLSDWSSHLYQEARRLAVELQAQTNTPCYIYLWNDFPNRSLADTLSEAGLAETMPKASDCPGCGSKWDVDRQQVPSREPFRKFHYRCNACQIVTHEPQVPWQDPEPTKPEELESETVLVTSPQDHHSEPPPPTDSVIVETKEAEEAKPLSESPSLKADSDITETDSVDSDSADTGPE